MKLKIEIHELFSCFFLFIGSPFEVWFSTKICLTRITRIVNL